jgi:hypothetical protein
MARRTHRPAPTRTYRLAPWRTDCAHCGHPLWVAYTSRRCVTTLQGVCQLILSVRECYNQACPLYHRPYRPEEEGHWALPHGEFGLDVIGLVGLLRYGEHRSLPEIHHRLLGRGVPLAERTLDHLIDRYEELVALHLSHPTRLEARLREQGQVILAIDGLQPDVGHEVLWILRDCLSGEILLARALLSSAQEAVSALLQEVKDQLPVPVSGLISDGQATIRDAIACVFPKAPHQICQFHYLRDAAKPIFEADCHAKKELKHQVRGIRPIERALEARTDAEAEALRGYCLAVRSALTDDGYPPLCASGLKLHDRLHLIVDSIAQLEQKRGFLRL